MPASDEHQKRTEAFLALLRYAENCKQERSESYTRLNGGGNFCGFSKHPAKSRDNLTRACPARFSQRIFRRSMAMQKNSIGACACAVGNCSQILRYEIPDAFCSSTSEWERSIALDGSLVDQGFSFENRRYEALRTKPSHHGSERGEAAPTSPHVK